MNSIENAVTSSWRRPLWITMLSIVTTLGLRCGTAPPNNDGGLPTVGTTFAKSYGGSATDQIRCGVEAVDGNVITAGYTDSFGAGGRDVWVMKQSSTGDLIWSRTLGDGEFSLIRVWDIQPTSDGGAVAVGAIVGDDPEDVNFGVVKLNDDGLVIWSHQLGERASIEEAFQVLILPDGGSAVCGTTGNLDELQARVAKFGADGTPQWDTVVPALIRADNSRADIEVAYDLVHTAEDALMVIGRADNDSVRIDLTMDGFVLIHAPLETNLTLFYPFAIMGVDDDGDDLFTAGRLVAGVEVDSDALNPIFDEEDADFYVFYDAQEQNVWEVQDGDRFADQARASAQLVGGELAVAGVSADCSAPDCPGQLKVLLLDSAGRQIGKRILEDFGMARDIARTSDGGMLIVGGAPNHDGLQQRAEPGYLVKLDTNLNLLWSEALDLPGGLKSYGTGVAETADGGILVSGFSSDERLSKAFDDVILQYLGTGWIVRFDADRNQVWRRVSGEGDHDQEGLAIAPSEEGGAVVVASTSSFGSGGRDAWVFKVSSDGQFEWDAVLGGPLDDELRAIHAMPGGHYVLAGYTETSGQGRDGWTVRLDERGDKVWEVAFGEEDDEVGVDLITASDKTCFVVGYGESGDSDHQKGWLAEIDVEDGAVGSWVDLISDAGLSPAAIAAGPEGDLLITGFTGSSDDRDALLLALSPEHDTIEWAYSYDSGGDDAAVDVLAVSGGFVIDPAYIVAGNTGSDIWVTGIDAGGLALWHKAYAGALTEEAFSVTETSDSAFLVAARSDSITESQDGWLLKIGPDGEVAQGGCANSLGEEIAGAFVAYAVDIEARQVTSAGFATSVVQPRLDPAIVEDVLETRQCAGSFDLQPASQDPDPDDDGSNVDASSVVGACCNATTGTCTDDLLEEDCQGVASTWTRETECEELSPPCLGDVAPLTGACWWCPGTCHEMGADECRRSVGLWMGYGSTCEIDACPEPAVKGACCIDSTCFFFSEADCDLTGGAYLGDDLVCAPDPCP